MGRERLRVWWRRLCRFALYSATFLVAALIVWHVYLSVRLGQASGRLRDMGYPTTLEELNAWVAIPDGERNAAELYTEAFDAIDEGGIDWKKLPRSIHVEEPPIGESYPQDVLSEIGRYVGQNETALELAHEAATIGRSRFYQEYSSAVLRDFLGFSYVGEIACLLQYEAIYEAEQGNPEASAAALTTLFSLADATMQEPNAIAFLKGAGVLSDTRAFPLERLIEGDNLDSKSLDALSSRLDKLQILPGTEIALVGDALMLENIFSWANMRRDEEQWKTNPEKDRPGFVRTVTNRGLWVLFQLSGVPKVDRIRFREVVVPLLETLGEIQDRGYSLAQGSTEGDDIIDRVLGTIGLGATGLESVCDAGIWQEAGRRCTVAVLAIEQFRIDTGRHADSLLGLVPDYLEEVPVDPFDGEPLRYQVTPDGYAVYSIGLAREDLGGYDFEKGEFRGKGQRVIAGRARIATRNAGFVVRRPSATE